MTSARIAGPLSVNICLIGTGYPSFMVMPLSGRELVLIDQCCSPA
jgi:hypothetical protein